MDFVGAKAAFFCGSAVLSCQRDDIPDLRWPGLWDLPGGGREGNESPEDCLLRELDEEFGLRLSPDRLLWRQVFPSILDASRPAFFFGGLISTADVSAVRFGNEGQGWALLPVSAFLARRDVVPEMQRRTALVWSAIGRT